MANHKILGLFLASILFLQLSLAFVSAAETITTVTTVTTTVTKSVTNVIDYIEEIGSPLFNALLGQTANGGELFLKILVFALITLIIYGLLGVAGSPLGTGWVNILAGAIISIIGIRFMPEGFLEAMTIQSSGLVAFVVMIVPFILAFFLIEKMPNRTARKALWISYIVIIVVLWFYNIGNANIGRAIWIYPIIILVCALVFWYDGTFHSWFKRTQGAEEIARAGNEQLNILETKIEELQESLARAKGPARIKEIQSQIAQNKATRNAFLKTLSKF